MYRAWRSCSVDGGKVKTTNSSVRLADGTGPFPARSAYLGCRPSRFSPRDRFWAELEKQKSVAKACLARLVKTSTFSTVSFLWVPTTFGGIPIAGKHSIK